MDNLTKLLKFLQKTEYNISCYKDGSIELSVYCVPENYRIAIFDTIGQLIEYLNTNSQI